MTFATRAALFALLGLGMAACSNSTDTPAPTEQVDDESTGSSGDDTGGDTAATGFCIQQIGDGAGSWSATFDDTCVDCVTEDAELAVDNDGDSFATVSVGSTSTGAMSLLATAQSGVVSPAGSTPAIKITHLRTGSSTVSQQFRTYLQGELQEESSLDLTGGASTMSGYGGTGFLQTTQPFDAFEFAVEFGPGVMETIEVYEFCGDYDPG